MGCPRKQENRNGAIVILHLVLSRVLAIGCYPALAVYFLKDHRRFGTVYSIMLTVALAGFFLIFYIKYFASLFFLSSEMDILEAFYLSMNPRRKRAIQCGTGTPKILPSALHRLANLLQTMIHIVRSALWINVTAISLVSGVLPINVRTRLTTTGIANAINIRNCCHSNVKGSVLINIAASHRIKEENSEVQLPYPYRQPREKYWNHWNDLEYEPRQFIEKDGSRVVVGALRTSNPGEYVN